MGVIDEIRGVLPADNEPTPEDTWELLRRRVTVLSTRVWEGRNDWPAVERWLANFNGRSGLDVKVERLHALFLLSQFLYIGSVEIRVLQRALYRDLFVVPVLQEIQGNLRTRDPEVIKTAFNKALDGTRFLGVGNPSESGVHLLYYFRQENRLGKNHFMDSAQIFASVRREDGSFERIVCDPSVDRYVFVDDVCGSGKTAIGYSRQFLEELVTLNKSAKLYYFAMFGTKEGMENIRKYSIFRQNCAAVFELDDDYKCLSAGSRYLREPPAHIDPELVRTLAKTYGSLLVPHHPVGFEDGQMLLGFHHNTPDNTLPIIWAEGYPDATTWTPAFRRYPKN